MKRIGDRIKERRTLLELTQEELGQKVEQTKFTISKYERNVAKPDVDTLRKLAVALDCTSDYLIGATDDPDNRVYTHENIKLEISNEYPYELTKDEVKELINVLKESRFDVDSLIKDIKKSN